MTTDIVVEVEGKALQLRKDKKHDWVMPTKDVAAGYGVSESVIRSHKERHADELLEGKHFISVPNRDANPRAGIPHSFTIWTKRGVMRLGFFIKSEPAKKFRDWAEEFILSGGATCTKRATLPNLGQMKEMHAKYSPSICLTIIGKSLNMSDDEIERMIAEDDAHKETKRQQKEIDVQKIRENKTIEPAMAEFLCGVTKSDKEMITVDEAYNIYKLLGGQKSKTNFGKEMKFELEIESVPTKIKGQTIRVYNISYAARAAECPGQLVLELA